jgi:hypothetical protein
MQEQNQMVGYIFNGAISYYSEEDVSQLIDNMTTEQSFYLITQALNTAQSKGVFNLIEAEIVSKALRILTTPKKEETPTE